MVVESPLLGLTVDRVQVRKGGLIELTAQVR